MNGFTLNEEELLKQFRRAKDIEIEHLLTQYGTSLKDVREMYPQLTTAISKRRLTTTLPTQPIFFTAGEAAEMGLNLQEGFMLKMSPGESGDGFKSSLITPEKWEITEDDLYISPSGEQYTRLELETALGMSAVGLPEAEIPTPSLEVQQIFGGVFPEQDIAEVLAYAEATPEAFLQEILDIGRTPETEALLRTMYEGVTEEWLSELFKPLEFRQTLIEALPAVTSTNIEGMLEYFSEKPEELRYALIYVGRNEDTERVVKWLFPEITDYQISDYFNPLSLVVEAKAAEGGQGTWGTFTAGVGDLVANIGGIFKWCGAEGVGDKIIKFGQYMQVQAEPVPFEPDEFTWRQLLNPQFYATYGVRMLPTLMLLAVPAIGAYSLAGSIAARVGLGVVGRAIITGIGGAAMSRPLESALEAGGAYDLARQQGFSHEQADEAADDVFNKNMALMGIDAVQLGVAFMPFGGIGRAATGAISRGLVTTAKIGGKLFFTGLTEGGEEVLQEMFQKIAMGEEVDLSDPDMQLVFALGAIAGIGMGGGAEIITRITNRGIQQLTPEQMDLFNKKKADFTAEGLSEVIATQKALDEVIGQHPEVGELIEEATKEVGREIASEQVEKVSNRRMGEANLPIPSEEAPAAETSVPVGEGVGLGVKDVATVFPQDEDLDAELEIPENKAIIDGLVVPNWIRTTLKGIARVPLFRKIHETTFGWRSLVDKTSQITEDIVGRAAVVYGAIRSIGMNVARVRVTALKNIIPNPVKYFGFNEVGYSEKMAARLLPDYESERKDAGTLEHVFTQPEMYNWTGMDAGLTYVTRVNQIIAAMNKLLEKEGVAFAAVSERWIHRVVTGRTIEGEVVGVRGKPGRTGARPGAVPSYKKPRTFRTMAEGIQALMEYEPNIEVSVSSFIEEAYKEIAGARFTKLVEEFGITPGERLLERYPEVAERAELTKKELADAAYLESVIKRAKRGEKLPGQTLLAIQRRFPEIGRQLRALVEEGGVAEKQMRKLLQQNERYITELRAQLAKAKVAVKPAEAKLEVTRIETADIEPHVETKYGNLPGEESEAVAKAIPVDLIGDRELTPEDLEKTLSTLKPEDAQVEIEATEATIGDQLGDLIETYRYESWEEGQNLERYLDSLLEVTNKYRKALGLPQLVDLTIEPLMGKPTRVAKPEPVVIPDEQKLREAFKLMAYEDRLAFRETMETQLQEIGRMIGEQSGELESLAEYLKTDPVASYRGHVGKKSMSLISLLKGGEFPETVTRKQAEMLTMGAQVAPEVVNKEGRVPWEYVLDELADHFKMGEQDLINRIEEVARTKVRADDIATMIDIAQERLDGVKGMLGVLSDVEAIPETIEAEVVEPMPEAMAMPERIVEVKGAMGTKLKMTPEEAVARRADLQYYTDLANRRLERLKATQAKNPDWEAYDPRIDEVIGIDIRIEEQEAVLGELTDELTRLEEAMEKAGVSLEAAPEAEVAKPELAPSYWIDPQGWNDMPVPQKVAWAQEAGLEGKVGSKSWDELTSQEVDALTRAREVREEAAIYQAAPAAMSLDQFKAILGRVTTETQSLLQSVRKQYRKRSEARHGWSVGELAELRATRDTLKDRLQVLEAMEKNPEDYYPRLQTEFPNLYQLLYERAWELRIIPRSLPKSPVVAERIEEYGLPEYQLLGTPDPKVIDRAEAVLAEAGIATIRTETPTEATAGGRYYAIGLRDIVDWEKATNALIEAGIMKGKPFRPAWAIPETIPGMPEAGLQVDMFGYQKPVTPKGKGEIVQISLDDYKKLVETYEEEGRPMPYMRVKPKIEGISELSGDTEFQQEIFSPADERTAEQRKAEFDRLSSEAKTLVEARKAPYWQARAERAAKMAIVSQPGIGEGYLPMPFAGGKIYNQDFIDASNKFFGVEKGNPVLKFTSDAAGILRITKAALDFSFMMLQGLPSFGLAHTYMAINPRIGAKLMGGWYKALADSTAAFFSPGVFYGYMAKNEQAALQRTHFGGSSRAIDYFEALKGKHGLGSIGAWTLRNIPLDPFGRAELAFYSAGEIVRTEFWKALSEKAIAQGKAFELARSLDLMTGLAQAEAMGLPLTMRQLESSFLWFAPNYTRACLSLLADIFRGGYTGAKAKQALGGMMAAGVVYYTGIQLAMALLSGKSMDDAWDDVKGGFGIREDPITHEVTWRPLSDFMGVKVGNYTFGVGSFWYGFVRLIGNIFEVINEVGNKERIDLVTILKHGAPNRDNPFIYWWYTRASPLTGLGFELATHKDFLGYPIETIGEYAQYILTRFEPIWMEQGINWMIPGAARDYEIPEGAARAAIIPFELFGWRSVPESTWVNFYDKAGEYIKQIPRDELDAKQIEAWQAGDLGWAQLTRKQKQDLINRYPELAGLYEEALNDSRIRQTPEWEAYTTRVDEERGIYHDRIDELTRRLKAGEIDTRTYRELASEAGMNYGSIIEAIGRDETYAEIFEYFEKKEADGSKYEFTFDLAYAEYNAQIRFADDPEIYLSNGDYNWDERDSRIEAFIAKHGETLYYSILDYISGEREEKGLNPVWIRRGQDSEKLSRTYWNLPYQPIMDMTQEDFEQGDIPAEYYGLWQTYQGLADVDKEGFVALNPELGKDWRGEYRRQNPEADAMLALWGYGGKLQSMEAYNLVKQWGAELGIPLSQMGLGLPTESLMPAYFEYSNVLIDYSAGSPQVKLWRLQNPGFNTWAMEHWGWEGTEDYKGIEYYQLQVKWGDKENEYNAIEGDIARRQFLEANTEYWTARLTMRAMNTEFPEDLIPNYVEWYQSDFKDYGDDWWLMEHPEFYQTMYDLEIWTEPRDFDTVPTREVWSLYEAYLKLPTGTPRLDFRAAHLELDAWLVLKFEYKPIQDRGNPEAELTPWQELAEAEAFKQLFM